jgi:hypothetical protein
MAASGFLTRYQPNFCAECGAKLLRLHWYLWTSRRFCNNCARRLRKRRLGHTLVTVLILLAAGFVVGRVQRPVPPPLTIIRRTDSPLPDGEPAQSNASVATTTSTSSNTVEEVYICGARTKKGTPCSRRVHGAVRCWQHMVVSPQVASVQSFMTDAKSNVCLLCA